MKKIQPNWNMGQFVNDAKKALIDDGQDGFVRGFDCVQMTATSSMLWVRIVGERQLGADEVIPQVILGIG